MDLYLTQNGMQRGPFRVFQVKEMIDRGEASPADLGWHSGLAGWLPLRDIDAIAPYLPPSTDEEQAEQDADEAPFGPETDGGTLPADSLPPRTAAPAPPPRSETRWQRFGLRALPRFLARSFDSMLWFSLVCLAGAALDLLPASAFTFPSLIGFWFIPLQSLVWVFLEGWLLSRFGTTPGKWLFNLHVRDHAGELPAFTSVLKRAFFIWAFTWGFGYSPSAFGLPVSQMAMFESFISQMAMFGSLVSLMLFLQSGRMVWDHLAGTEIIHASPRPAAWVVYAVSLGVYLGVRMLFILSQPLPDGLAAEVRAQLEQQRATLREAYRQSRPNDSRRID